MVDVEGRREIGRRKLSFVGMGGHVEDFGFCHKAVKYLEQMS